GRTSFGRALHLAPRHLLPGGLLIIISDWWMDDPEADLKALGGAGQELIAIHVTAPEEAAPAALGGGEVRLIDAESGHEVELVLDRATLDRYAAALAEWRDRLRQNIARQQGRYLAVRSDDDPER